MALEVQAIHLGGPPHIGERWRMVDGLLNLSGEIVCAGDLGLSSHISENITGKSHSTPCEQVTSTFGQPTVSAAHFIGSPILSANLI